MFLRILFTPSCWIRNHPTSLEWDEWLSKALEDPEISELGNHDCLINGKGVWISNYPYCYGGPRRVWVLPKRSTVFRLHDIITNHPDYVPPKSEKEKLHDLLFGIRGE